MTKMPGRPREHQLEALSEQAIRSRIPIDWVVTKPQDDYGIDLNVEVFEGGFATGLQFNVQLKSTDKSSPVVRLKTSTLNYWNALSTLTLVVLYQAQTDELLWEWSHLLEVRATEAKAHSVRLNRAWGDSTPEAIVDEVRGRRALQDVRSNLPIFVEAHGDDPAMAPLLLSTRAAIPSLTRAHPALTIVRAVRLHCVRKCTSRGRSYGFD